METEIWKLIPGFPNYQASSLGRIKSLARTLRCKDGFFSNKKEKILAQTNDGKGYLHVTPHIDGKRFTTKVHILVAMAFHGYVRSSGMVVDHINNNSLDNMACNLQIITHRLNATKDIQNKTSKYAGVSWSKPAEKWQAQIKHKTKVYPLGLFTDEYEAHLKYKEALFCIENGQDFFHLCSKPKPVGHIYKASKNRWRAKYFNNHVGMFKSKEEAKEAILMFKKSMKTDSL